MVPKWFYFINIIFGKEIDNKLSFSLISTWICNLKQMNFARYILYECHLTICATTTVIPTVHIRSNFSFISLLFIITKYFTVSNKCLYSETYHSTGLVSNTLLPFNFWDTSLKPVLRFTF